MKVAAMESQTTPRALWLKLAFGLLIAVAGTAGTTRASGAEPGEPPARAARIAEVSGDAWLFDPEAKEWTRVSRNQTVGEGDRLRTDDQARVSLRIGSTSLWLDERSDLEFDQLDEGRVLLKLDKGDLGLRLRSHEAVAEYRVRTRDGLMVPEQSGLYRVEQLDHASRVYAWSGALRFESSRDGVTPVNLGAGEQAEIWWAGSPRAERSRIANDDFGGWVLAQSREEGDQVLAQKYVSPEMTGAEDLDRHGRWEQDSEYGNVWFPVRVVDGWAPYRDGRWAWTVQWGWTWVDNSPWGFAPFHYGRWVTLRGRWCWVPGRFVARPAYAPALVGFMGPSLGVSITIGGGRQSPPRHGWYPLAPRETYVPVYRNSPRYEGRFNDRHHDHRTGSQRTQSNREVAGAVSFMGPATPVVRTRNSDSWPSNRQRGDRGDRSDRDERGFQQQQQLQAPQLQGRPTVEPQRPEGRWRDNDDSSNSGSRGERRERGPDRTPPQIQQQQPTVQPQIVQPQVQAPQQPQQQERPRWRGHDRGDDRPQSQQQQPSRGERFQERMQERQQQQAQQQAQQPQVQPQRAQPAPPAAAPAVMPPMPQPRPQVAPEAQRPQQRNNDERGEQRGGPRKTEGGKRETER